MGYGYQPGIAGMKLRGKKMEVRETYTGHLIWRLQILEADGKKEMVLQIKDNDKEKWTNNKILKIHQRFGHASKEKLTQLIKSSEETSISSAVKKLIHRTVEECEVCHANKNQGRRNKSVLYRNQDFNEGVAIDLTEWFDKEENTKRMICHMVDKFSRLSVACFIPNKKPESVIKAIMNEWMSKYGTCEKITS